MSDGPTATLVALSPVGSDRLSWRFADLPNANVFEYPGHGEREYSGSWTHEQMADEVVERFEGPLDLVGIAIGGRIAQLALIRHPDRIRSAVLICTSPVTPLTDREARRREVQKRADLSLDGMGAVCDATFPRWFTSRAIRTHHEGVKDARRSVSSMDPEAWSAVWWAGFESETVPAERLKEIRQPVTIVGALHDASAGIRGALTLHKLIGRSRTEIVPGPHMLHLETPDNVAAAVDRHFRWLVTGHRIEQLIGASAR